MFALLTLLGLPALAAPATVHHDLTVQVDPSAHTIDVTDSLSPGPGLSPDSSGAYHFVLHQGLIPTVETKGWSLVPIDNAAQSQFTGLNVVSSGAAVPLQSWVLTPKKKQRLPITLRYSGVIHHPIVQSGEEYQRSFQETPGTIEEQGVFLSGSSYWLPTFGDGLVSFNMDVIDLPQGDPDWQVVSQGHRTVHDAARSRWESPEPVDEVYLVAGPWYETVDTVDTEGGEVDLLAFLREDDSGLAYRYLQATRRYMKLYESMLPAYPYHSFALVENFWDTGYGMPGFTLLGPQIIRFPWVLTSSYPHELLHNWWGNSVFVEPPHAVDAGHGPMSGGNWCEGLTAYMADHLFAEDRGEGVNYRRSTLKKYTDFVQVDDDFPLVEFGGRSSASSEAVGYGKALMLFHMVRRALDEPAFLAALNRFYTDNQYQRAGFDDIARAFTQETGQDWAPFFQAWTTRTGAPRVELVSVEVADDHSVTVKLRQAQAEDPFPVVVPVVITVEGRDEPLWAEVPMSGRDAQITIAVDGRPLRLDVDPGFDVMRRLDPLEVAPTISTLMGADAPVFVLPSKAGQDELAAWKALAARWAQPGQPRLITDDSIEVLPEGNVWLLGWNNGFAGEVVDALPQVQPAERGLRIQDDTVPKVDHSVVLVARAQDPDAAVGWVAGPTAAIPGLARKLPHYTRYGLLAFQGSAPDNIQKGIWEPADSPLVRDLSGEGLVELVPPERAPLAPIPGLFDAQLIGRTASYLADPARQGRGLGSTGLAEATAWVEEALSAAGLEPAGDDGGYRQVFTGQGPEGDLPLTNLLAAIPGTDPSLAPVVVLAHLDHLGRGWPDVRDGNEGMIHPGADDNASGVAVALELARAMVNEPPHPREVLFAFTTGEESGLQGARHLVQTAPAAPFACVCVDTVGRLNGRKLLVLDAASAAEWRYVFMGVGYTTGVPIAITPEPLDSSDQGACLEAGIPAVQLFSGPTEDYHRPTDTADKLDAQGMASAAEAAHEALVYMADRTEALTVQLGAPGGHPQMGPQGGERKVSLGTMPDFAFEGTGVRVEKIMEGSAAAVAGLQAGDVIVSLDGQAVRDLRSYSKLLKAHAPGDVVRVTVQREGERITVEVTLRKR